jgi:hypothetical protein
MDIRKVLSATLTSSFCISASSLCPRAFGELPAIKIGGRGVWRVGRKQLEEFVERLHKETAEWAKAHPLNPKDKDSGAEELG